MNKITKVYIGPALKPCLVLSDRVVCKSKRILELDNLVYGNGDVTESIAGPITIELVFEEDESCGR